MVSGLLLRGLLAGMIAGLFAAAFSFAAGEPPLERALDFEAAMASAAKPGTEIVSRSTQRGAGLFSAHIVYGAAAGGLFSLVFALIFGRVGDIGPRVLAALLALGAFIALVLVPELKYPANPPGIGAEETIGARTALYFAMLALSLLAMILAVTLGVILASRHGPWASAIITAAVFLFVAGIAGAALPRINEVPAGFPASVLWNFRLASLAARAVLWGVLGLAFGAMAQKWLERGQPNRV
ncbi:MAG: CbtA family protein [Beijerinckiaceae bacterium]|nr:CbtA family protein [Beijerinckiaceae bacterium]